MNTTESQPETPSTARPALQDLFVFEAGDRVLAVFADQVDGTTDARVPAVLPHAPATILGVVCVRGRMLTVLDPIALLTGEALNWPQTLPYVVALRGDEQLALAAQTCRDTITISAADIERPVKSGEDGSGLLIGLVRYAGEKIIVLNHDRLFATAMWQKERRRRRF